MLLLGLWVPAQAVAGFGLISFSGHAHNASLSERGHAVLHHHDIGSTPPPIAGHAHDHEAPVEHHHGDDGDDHVVVSAEPARSSSSHDSLVRELGSDLTSVSTRVALASCSPCSPWQLRRPPPTGRLSSFQRNPVRLL